MTIRDPQLWANLAGPPARISRATSPRTGNAYNGWIKIRLCHGKGRSYLLPDFLIGFNGTKFYIPSFFGPPALKFGIPNDSQWGNRYSEAELSIDVAAPKGQRALRLQVVIRSDWLVHSFSDGAQLYECTYAAPLNTPVAPHVSGNCSRLPNGDFALEVFHHTTEETIEKISASKELWSGPYNLAGTRKLKNVAYTYFTTLSKINDELDLRRIAMSSDAKIPYQTTSEAPVESVLDLPVYRGVIAERTATLAFDVPSELIAPAHLLFHRYVPPNPAYYEVVGSEIVRVAVKPGAKLIFDERAVDVDRSNLQHFDYIVEGDASSTTGLEAPMKEDETDQVAYLEKLDEGYDLFEFWRMNANTDLFSRRRVEVRKLEETD